MRTRLPSFTRHPFTASSREQVASFVSAASRGAISDERSLSVLTHVVSGPDAVYDLWQGEERHAVAVLIDSAQNDDKFAELSIFPSAPSTEVADVLLAWAEDYLKASPHRHLHIPLWYDGIVPMLWLAERGFSLAYTMYEMTKMGESELMPTPSPLPSSLQWQTYHDDFLHSYYETLRLSFIGIPGLVLPSMDAFKARSQSQMPPVNLLVNATGQVMGFVRVERRNDGSGELAILGRHPDWRGQGIGHHLVHQGLAVLKAMGITTFHLEVAAVNDKAIALYQRFGFTPHKTKKVYTKALQPL